MSDVSNITIDDVLIWIIQNKRDTDAMDKINVATYPYTAKFLARRAAQKAERASNTPNNENTQA